MSKFQLLSCDIALGGDILNVVARHAHIPVTYPELLALKSIHAGQNEGAVSAVYDVGYVERSEAEERGRLNQIYGADTIGKLFPGAGIRLPVGDNAYKPRVVELVSKHVVDLPEPVVAVKGSFMDGDAEKNADAAYVPVEAPEAEATVPEKPVHVPHGRRVPTPVAE